MKKLILAIILLAVLSASSFAEVMISEIMYNPLGTETKKEWIEIYNKGENALNISSWKIQDGTTLRTLLFYRGENLIAPDSFVLIVRSGENFSNEYPLYTGTIFESSFSLTNSGKEIYLLNEFNEVVDYVAYTDLSDEGYTIEINDSSADNSLIENWILGILNGDPGNIRKTQEENPDNDTTDDEKEEEDNQEEENDNADPNGVPEFGMFGTIIILTLAVVILFRRRE